LEGEREDIGMANREATNVSEAGAPTALEMPAPTAFPMVLASAVTLLFAGLVTSPSISMLGIVLMIVGSVGWFRDVLPIEGRESIPVLKGPPTVRTMRPVVTPFTTGGELSRARLPLEIYPVSAGLKGGIAGGVAMALLAMLYGLVSAGSVWYPINLLAAGFFPSAATASIEALAAFHREAFLLAVVIHSTTSIVVGLLYGATLPMLPRRPILLGGIIAPLVWTGLLRSALGIINPVLDAHIDWLWFVLSQLAFGFVAGTVVARQERVATWQRMPLAVRVGIEAIRPTRGTGEARPDVAARRRRRDVGVQRGSWPADRRLGGDGAEQGRELRRALRQQLRGMPRRKRWRRARAQPCRSRVSRDRRRSHDPTRDRRGCPRHRDASVRGEQRRDADRGADRRDRSRDPYTLGARGRARRDGSAALCRVRCR
jgi:hypothetical protein